SAEPVARSTNSRHRKKERRLASRDSIRAQLRLRRRDKFQEFTRLTPECTGHHPGSSCRPHDKRLPVRDESDQKNFNRTSSGKLSVFSGRILKTGQLSLGQR